MTAGELPERLAGPELDDLWRRAWRAMATAGDGWPSVRISVPVAGDEQRRALAGLLARSIRPGTARVGVDLGDLDARVRRPGDGWDLRAAVEVAGGPLPDRRGDRERRSAAVEQAVAAARAAGPGDGWFARWLDGVTAGGTASRLVGRGEGGLLAQAAAVLAGLPAGGEPLPAVAARLTGTGDTKALNAGTGLAGLVLGGVAAMLGEPRPRTAADRRMLWEAVGVVPDDLASQVLVLNLPVGAVAVDDRPDRDRVADPEGMAGRDPLTAWLADASLAGEPFRVTLHQLTRWRPRLAPAVPVFVCENPAVLRSAAARLGPASAPLVCTEGRPSVAASRLLGLLAEAGASLRVRADFDWPGLRIAGALLADLDAAPWRFGAGDYATAVRARAGAAASAPRLGGVPAPSPWDPGLAGAMAETGEVVYEEEMLDLLVADLSTST